MAPLGSGRNSISPMQEEAWKESSRRARRGKLQATRALAPHPLKSVSSKKRWLTVRARCSLGAKTLFCDPQK